MRRHWAPFLVATLVVLLLPMHAQAGMPLFDPTWHIVPNAHELDAKCAEGAPLGFGGVLQLIQNLMNAAVSLGILISVLVIAFAGILWILTPTNPENHSRAKKILMDAVIGLLIILSAWLIVDFVMKTLYNGDTAGWGPWNTILIGGDYCITAKTVTPLFSGSIVNIPGQGGGYTGGPATLGTAGCSPSTIISAAAAGGYTLNQAAGNTFSCIAKSESSCGTNTSGATTPSGDPTTATGMFQIVIGLNDTCHNLNISACTSAARNAGWRGTGNLNCSTAFSGGKAKPGMEELARVCKAAATNLTCNVSAAACLLVKNPSFSDWTADPRSSAQKACVTTFAGG